MRFSSASRKRATAALIPSSEVPDIKPTTTPEAMSTLPDWWRRFVCHTPNYAAVFREQLFGLLTRRVFLLHDDGELDALVGALEQPGRLFTGDAAYLHHNSLTAIDQFVVGGAQIDHQGAVGLAHPDHRAGGDG